MFLKIKLIEPSIVNEYTKELEDRLEQIQNYHLNGNSYSGKKNDSDSEGNLINKSKALLKTNKINNNGSQS